MKQVLALSAVLDDTTLPCLDAGKHGLLGEDRVGEDGSDEVGGGWGCSVGSGDGSLLETVELEVGLTEVLADLSLKSGSQVALESQLHISAMEPNKLLTLTKALMTGLANQVANHCLCFETEKSKSWRLTSTFLTVKKVSLSSSSAFSSVTSNEIPEGPNSRARTPESSKGQKPAFRLTQKAMSLASKWKPSTRSRREASYSEASKIGQLGPLNEPGTKKRIKTSELHSTSSSSYDPHSQDDFMIWMVGTYMLRSPG